jgi:hypothetical protein
MNKIILVSILLMALAFPASAVNDVSIGNHIVDPDGQIRVPIYLNDSTGVAGVAVRLEYDPAVVRAYSDPLLDQGAFLPIFVYAPDNSHNATGWITITAAKTGEDNLLGNMIIGYVRLQAVGSAGSSSLLDLTINSLADAAGDDVSPYSATDGSFAIKGQTPEPKIPGVLVRVTGVGVIGTNIMDIARVEYSNFSSGDAYNISVNYPNGTLAKFTSGTLSGATMEIIPVDYVPIVTGDHNVTAYGNGIIGSTEILASDSAPVPVVPELSSIVLLSAGLVGLIGIRRFKRE